jgi:predicted nucleotidyltransferase
LDVLVAFAPGARLSLVAYQEMQEELAAIFGHPVDIVSRTSIEKSPNWIRRQAIRESGELPCAA